MDEAMGRRTVGGLLITKAGSILVFREESSRHKASSCCTRLGCSSKLFPSNKDKKCRTANEAAARAPQRSPVFRKSNRMYPQGVNACGGTIRSNSESTSGATDNRPRRRDNAGRDLLVRLKERVNASRKRSSNGENGPPLSLNTSVTASSRLIRNRRRLQGGPVSSLEESLNDSNEYWHFDMNENEEAEDYLFNDRHRGMRMDIDDMSYEELLALGERIGTVSTGLSDGVLSKCLKRSRYVPTTSSRREDAEIKCIICQEEYLAGAEVAKMICNHYYHFTCIQQWLSQKNWCPICKSVASTVTSQCS